MILDQATRILYVLSIAVNRFLGVQKYGLLNILFVLVTLITTSWVHLLLNVRTQRLLPLVYALFVWH